MLGFIGGTGPEGKGLALRFAISGLSVFIGSREKQRGIEAAQEIRSQFTEIGSDMVAGGTNEEAAIALPQPKVLNLASTISLVS